MIALFPWIGSEIQAKEAGFGSSFLLGEGKQVVELHDDSESESRVEPDTPEMGCMILFQGHAEKAGTADTPTIMQYQ